MSELKVAINAKIKSIPHSPTLLVNEQVVAQREKGNQVYHFGFGQSPFPVPELLEKSLAECANLNHYMPSQGLPELTQSIADYHQSCFDDDVSKDDVVIGPGSKELIFHLLMLLEGPLLIPAPSWVSYEPQAKILNKTCHRLQTSFVDEYALSPETLEETCQNLGKGQKILLLNTPNNPTGRIYSKDRLEALAQVCKKHQVLVISDEIYALLSFNAFYSMKQFYPEGTLVTSGLSKAFSAGGYRLGYCIIPSRMDELRTAWISLISETYSCVATPIQYAAHSVYSSIPQFFPYIRKCTLLYQTICNVSQKHLENLGLNCLQTQGGFYLFPDFNNLRDPLKEKNITTSIELADHLLKNYQVAMLPGSAFYMPADHLSLRMAPVDFDGSELISQSFDNQQLTESNAIAKLFPNVIAGLDKISEFVSSLNS